jgi:hypothetical protein
MIEPLAPLVIIGASLLVMVIACLAITCCLGAFLYFCIRNV